MGEQEFYPKVGKTTEDLTFMVKEFINILEIEECSDNERIFRPNGISSCRIVDGLRMNELLNKMKEIVNE